MKALSQFNRVIKLLKELEDKHTAIFKLEMFSDTSGDCYYMPDTGMPWKYAFPFADIENLEQELIDFELFIEKT
jgi:hypothetical protein